MTPANARTMDMVVGIVADSGVDVGRAHVFRVLPACPDQDCDGPLRKLGTFTRNPEYSGPGSEHQLA